MIDKAILDEVLPVPELETLKEEKIADEDFRRMFEAGGQLKARYGAENVYDFSLGNPDLPAPAAVGEGLRRFAEHAGEPFAFGYMPNAGFPWAR